MRNRTNSNKLIKYFVVAGDFIVMNALLYVYVLFFDKYWGTGLVNRLYDCYLIVNLAMVISQSRFSTLLHERLVTSDRIMQRTAMLCATHCLFSYVLYKPFIFIPVGKFTMGFAVVLYLVLLLVRLLERLLLKYYRRMGRNKRYVMLIGSDKALIRIYESLAKDPSMGYSVKGYMADEDIEGCPAELHRIGTLADVEQRMDGTNGSSFGALDEVYCCMSSDQSELLRRIASWCDQNVVRFYYLPRSLDRLGMRLKIEQVGSTFVFSNHEEPLDNPANRLIKRTLDLLMAIPICLCLLPLIPIIALIIKIQSPGPIFFKQLRTGINGSDFYCYKFRSMHVNSDADTVQATKNDPRKFAFGNFMRKSNIDELPQFFNVLMGHMSVVGPRPHMLHHTETYRKLISKYMVRHFVKPGITGWAQVTGFRGETKELWQMEGRIERDIWYIENWTPWLDVRIIWLTIRQVFIHDEHAY